MKSEWKEVCLGEITKWSSGGTPSKNNPLYWNGTIPWISAKNMPDGWLDDAEPKITELGLNNGSRLAPSNSILMLVRGSGLYNRRYICIVKKTVAFNQDVKCIEASSSVLPEFVYYWLRGNDSMLVSLLESTGIGAGKFDVSRLQKMHIMVPSLYEQEKLVKVARSIDDKIALNNKINENLEQQAQLLYKQYFPYSVNDKLPDGWHVGAVGEIVEIHDAKRIPLSGAERAKMKKKTYPYYGAAALMDYVDDYIFDGKYLLLGEDGTVVDNAGYPILQYVWGQFWVNNHAHVLTGKLGFNVESLYMLFKQTPVKAIVTGAVQPKISQANLRSIQVVIPPENLLMKYNNKTESLFSLFRANNKANKTLAALRDLLLPKLMNGEIDVADIAL